MFDVEKVREDFPVLHQEVHPGVPLVYLDSAASSQKPRQVIEAMDHYYRHLHANVHRGIHTLSEAATNAYESARERVARFINAPEPETIVFVRNATEAINLVAATWGRRNVREGDEILLTEMEHHANLVPWMMLAEEKGAHLRYVPLTAQGLIDLSAVERYLNPRTKIFAFTAMSNVLGSITPVAALVSAAHSVGAIALVDAAQSVPHMPVDVQALDCDFLAFSGHKMCGPTGSGVLYGRRELLEAMPPYMGGGDMIRRVTFEGFETNDLPYKFEAGTPAIAEAVGLGAAVDYLNSLGMENVHRHEQFITNYAMEALSEVEGLKLLGPPAAQKGGLATFILEGIHPHDIAHIADEDGIAIRAGHHCAMPLHRKLGIAASARASFYVHTTTWEIDRLVQSLQRAREIFRLQRAS
ncbi:MAG: cysteine desulfurase [Chloroflexi bacterium]|jgi:cysteine desulfurase/selenocysteine lyase|nr:cysteine desulfurase [Chloroflexota bacterium]